MLVSPVMGGMIWKIGGREIDLSRRGMIMGVLNVTPDSFSDGGKFFSQRSRNRQACKWRATMERRSSMSAANRRDRERSRFRSDEELRRVLPVIKKLREKVSALISIDTSKAEVADAALDAGAVDRQRRDRRSWR